MLAGGLYGVGKLYFCHIIVRIGFKFNILCLDTLTYYFIFS
jgi:hypothetical protein